MKEQKFNQIPPVLQKFIEVIAVAMAIFIAAKLLSETVGWIYETFFE